MGSRSSSRARGRRGEKTGLARYYELYLALANALRDGTYGAGDTLPSEPQLMQRYQLSRSTVRRALQRLEQEQRIVRRHGSGTYASPSPDGERTNFSSSSFFESSLAIESTTSARWLQRREIPTPPRLLKLAPEFDPAVVHIERVRISRGRPFSLSAVYLAPRWGRLLTRARLGSRAVALALASAGARFSIAHQYYAAMLADQQQARHLAVDIGAPLLHVTSLFREESGHVSHFEEWFQRSDIHTLHAVIDLTGKRPGPRPQRRARKRAARA